MIRHWFVALDGCARFVLCLIASLVLAACGSGAVSGPAPTPVPSAIAISPSTATVYSNLPTTFVVTGGNGSYIVTSSNQAVIAPMLSLTSNGFTIVPNDVSADTAVTLTVQDTASNTPAIASLTVKPRTISNLVTITPSTSQSAACGSAICSGGDAEVRVVLSQGGIPLVGRVVRFDVVSGEFRIITSAPGAPEAVSLSGTAATDNTGTARIRVRVLADATAQTGLLQITDMSSGYTSRTSLSIAPSSNAPLNAQPATITFIGPSTSSCATSTSADVIVFGGRPPYSISQPGSFGVSPTVVASSGGRFTVSGTGQCASSSIAVVDSNGATVSITASNNPAPFGVSVPPFVVAPLTVTLESCNDVASVVLAGGLGAGTYMSSSGNSAVQATISGNSAFISRAHSVALLTSTTVPVAFSDGRSVQTVSVALTTGAQAACP